MVKKDIKQILPGEIRKPALKLDFMAHGIMESPLLYVEFGLWWMHVCANVPIEQPIRTRIVKVREKSATIGSTRRRVFPLKVINRKGMPKKGKRK